MPEAEPSLQSAPGAWLGRYLVAVHVARIALGVSGLAVAVLLRDAIPGGAGVIITLTGVALAWALGTALLAPRLHRLLERRPGLVWIDPAVLIGLSALAMPWGTLAAAPYGSFILLVPFARPWQLALTAAAAAVAAYAPKLVLTAGGWRHAGLVAPDDPGGWLTLYVGPVFAGGITVVLCILVNGVRNATEGWVRAREEAAAAYVLRSRAEARRALANRLHATLSQVMRAIPVRLHGPPPPGLSDRAAEIRAEVIALSSATRPRLQALARALRK